MRQREYVQVSIYTCIVCVRCSFIHLRCKKLDTKLNIKRTSNVRSGFIFDNADGSVTRFDLQVLEQSYSPISWNKCSFLWMIPTNTQIWALAEEAVPAIGAQVNQRCFANWVHKSTILLKMFVHSQNECALCFFLLILLFA